MSVALPCLINILDIKVKSVPPVLVAVAVAVGSAPPKVGLTHNLTTSSAAAALKV